MTRYRSPHVHFDSPMLLRPGPLAQVRRRGKLDKRSESSGPNLGVHAAIPRFPRNIGEDHVATKSSFKPHPGLLHDSGRSKVFAIAVCRSSPDIRLSQRPVHQGGEGFAHVPSPPTLPGEDIAVFDPLTARPYVNHAYQAIRLLEKLDNVRIVGSVDPCLQALPEKVRRFLLASVNLPRQVTHHLGIGSHTRETTDLASESFGFLKSSRTVESRTGAWRTSGIEKTHHSGKR